MAVASSSLISTLQEAVEYYAARLAGNHTIESSGVTITVRFNPEEIHLFTEDLRPGSAPPAEKLVRRPGGHEVRVFSLVRARLLDRVLPAIQRPARCLAAKGGPGRVQLIGPADATGGRLSVVIGWDHGLWFVRTAFPLTTADFARQLRSRPAPWPPK